MIVCEFGPLNYSGQTCLFWCWDGNCRRCCSVATFSDFPVML